MNTIYEATAALKDSQVDLLILDLNVPPRTGEEARPEAGLRLLDNLKLASGLRRPAHIVGLTAFEELANAQKEEFEREGWHLILFKESSDDWATVLTRKLIYVAEWKAGLESPEYGVDVALVTAMQSPELDAVLDLEATWSRQEVPGDEGIYHKGTFRRGADWVEVVACCATEVGMPAATATAMKVIMEFRPRFIAAVGIAAGVRGSFGDILVADQSWDYGSGKSRYRYPFGFAWWPWGGRITFDPAPVPILVPALLKAKLALFGSRKRETLSRIMDRWTGEKPPGAVDVQPGPMASGAAVLENRPLINEIKSHNRKLIGIEMETYGLFVASRICRRPKPFAFAIKSICDFGDHRKGDKWQAFAAFTSAQYLYEFSLDHLCSPKARKHKQTG